LLKPEIIKLKKYSDTRVFFKNILDKDISKNFKLSKNIDQYQISISHNKKNVLRGLHYQKPMQNKFIYLLKGKIQDVSVNINKKSKNYGKVYEFILNENKDLLFIPSDFAHGFLALEESTIIYILDKNYNSSKEVTIDWNDNNLSIKWKCKNPIISHKDSRGIPFEK
jgi:dTDP-4-dehydrorhamnose 3,5-epimerase